MKKETPRVKSVVTPRTGFTAIKKVMTKAIPKVEPKEPSLAGLKALAIKKGVSQQDIEGCKTKSAVVTIIRMKEESLKAAQAAEEAVKVAQTAPRDNSINSILDTIERDDTLQKRFQGDAGIMRDKWLGQRRVPYSLALEPNQKVGKVMERRDKNGYFYQSRVRGGDIEVVTADGFPWLIARGVRNVMIPLQVAEILGESEENTAKAGKDFLWVDPK